MYQPAKRVYSEKGIEFETQTLNFLRTITGKLGNIYRPVLTLQGPMEVN